MALTLVIGNKNYSSWSFRPWIAMETAGIAFDEVVISLEAEDFKERVFKVSGTGKVPVLVDGDGEGLGVARDPGISGRQVSRRPGSGRPIRRLARTPVSCRRRCTPASCRFAAIAR